MEVAMTDGARRLRKHRGKMNAAGLKPMTNWVPEVNSPKFMQEVARGIEIINNSAEEKVILEELSDIEIEGWK
jgi:antidote-toxin recognition MazE-like antitoxin